MKRILMLWFAVAVVWAADPTGSINGTVLGPSGAAVVGAGGAP